jgi:multiple sugar transport system permease protein
MKTLRRALIHGVLLTLSAIFVLPFVWLLLTSVKGESHMMRYPPEWVPQAEFVHRAHRGWWEILQTEDLARKGQPGQLRVKTTNWTGRQTATLTINAADAVTRHVPLLRHYLSSLTTFNFALFLQNSLFVCTVSILATLASSSLIAYSFSILRWPGRDFCFYAMLGTMMLPAQVTMVPVFLIFRHLGLVDTFAPLLAGSFFGNAFFVFLLRQFFLTIPTDLIEAARMDGCSDWRVFWQIVLPLSVPALAVVGLFTFLAQWNDFLGPLIYLVDESKYTLALGLAMFQGQYTTQYGELMAMSALLTLPVIILFFFAQKTFIQGIKTTGSKG